jgi:hypothetical protein
VALPHWPEAGAKQVADVVSQQQTVDPAHWPRQSLSDVQVGEFVPADPLEPLVDPVLPLLFDEPLEPEPYELPLDSFDPEPPELPPQAAVTVRAPMKATNRVE